ncbi:MAG TPA: alpha/beta fold hydrolase [Gemmatimonadaceae bacterium]|nr:alpha/beta fold hydrolase [Gemmatimonadaceae bacterium]
MRGEFVDIGGTRLYYYAAGSRGSGAPVLLIHGFATSGHLWRQVVPSIPEGHRVIAVDLAGHGRSETATTGNCSPAAHAALLIGLLDDLSSGPVHVAAHGFGCEIALALAAEPSRVISALLVSPAGLDQRSPCVPAPRSTTALALQLPWGALGTGLLQRHLARGYASSATAAHSLPRHLQWFRGRTRRAALVAQLDALSRQRAAAAAVEHPFEIVVGGGDPFVSPRRVSARFLAPSRGTLTMLGAERHFLPEEAPDTIARLLGRLLEH